MTAIPEAEPRSGDFVDVRGAYWARMRELGRVVRDSASSVYYVTRREDVLAALRDTEAFKPAAFPFHVTMPDGQEIVAAPLSMSAKDHARIASALYAPFTARSLSPFSEAIRAHARSLIADVAPVGRCEAVFDDFVHLFCQGALLIVCGMALDQLPEMASLMGTAAADHDGVLQHRLLHCLMVGLASGYRRRPGILWDLMDAVDGGGSLTLPEFCGLLLLLPEGSKTAVNATRSALLRLARDAYLRQQLRDEPELVGRFVEEVVRLSGSAISAPRITSCEVTIGEVTLPAHTTVALCFESASCEEGGNDFSIAGKRQRHWGFGGGIHRCLGAHLARLEMTIFVAEWLQQIPDFELEPGFQPAVDGFSALTALPLRWDMKGD
jgi:cytochrome P450